MNDQQPATWFWNVVLEGIQRLVVLRLDGAPAGDTIIAVQRTWVEALWPGRAWYRERDEARIREGFRRLGANAERWPAPVQLKRHLPPTEWNQPYKALPPIEHTPEDRALARREIAKIRDKLRMGGQES